MTPEESREYVRQWLQAGPELLKVRREELRLLSDENVRAQISALLELGAMPGIDRPTSGLVEQQRFFQKALT
jgi:hypothetical protein